MSSVFSILKSILVQIGNAGDKDSTNEPSSPLIFRALASYRGRLKEMTETSRGQWEVDPWAYESTLYDPNGYYRHRDYIEATYQLIVESKDTRFVEGERQVLTHLSKLLDNQSMADVTFVVKNEKIGAHSAIVVSGSPVICAMLEKDKLKGGQTKTVQVDDIDPSVFKEMLRYLYTGKTQKLDEDAMTEPLFMAADKYQIEALKDLCEQSLISKLNMQTAVHFLALAHQHTAPQLLESSLKYLVEHKKEVWTRAEWKELMKNHADLFFLASHRMVG
jgi:speckle-type POZ protein